MRTNRDHMSGWQTLAVRWRALGLLAVAMARHVMNLKRRRAPNALRQAELLEAWLFAAIAEMTTDVRAETAVTGKPAREDEHADARHYINIVYAYLMILALFVRQLISDLRAAGDNWAVLLGIPAIPTPAGPARQRIAAPPFLDSG